ncbi:MAG TPA: Rho termination factor N-terminal domain-containing protein [Solirubrobacteraceae bacterium]|jgi:transcription termination factor Rho|nr:Rho termination factor N-terminal domain-containing protein [Solirubrobacteraceae bacterium]
MAAVLDRSELEASPLADLHAIADQLGLDGFRRLRKADLIDRILGDAPAQDDGDEPSSSSQEQEQDSSDRPARSRRRGGRSRRSGSASREGSEETAQDADDVAEKAPREKAARERTPRERGGRRERSRGPRDEEQPKEAGDDENATVAEGVVEVLGNGSAFLRIDPPEPSDGDVYISAAQVRRCELVSGDRVAGPARTPRRSERYPSLVRIDTINGNSADAVSAGARYEDLPVDYPSERIALESKDPTLQAIEWLTPFGRGSRVTIVGAARAGKTETLRGLLQALVADRGSASDGLEVSLVLAGARPEEIAQWQQGALAPAAALSFAASSDSQSQAVERTLETAKRVAARGGNAVVLIDSLDALSPQAARKALAAARNLREGGSLTVIATAAAPFGGESTVIALDVGLTSTGRQPIIDLAASGTLKPELLVGDDGAQAITQARASALEAS